MEEVQVLISPAKTGMSFCGDSVFIVNEKESVRVVWPFIVELRVVYIPGIHADESTVLRDLT